MQGMGGGRGGPRGPRKGKDMHHALKGLSLSLQLTTLLYSLSS